MGFSSTSSQDFRGLVRASRTYRRFDASRSLGEAELRDLLETVRFAPTGNNLQPVRFRIVCEPDMVAQLVKLHGWAALLKDFNGPAAPDELPGAYIGLCLPKGKGSNPINLIDVGILAQTLALAAAAQGIGSCMIKSYQPQAAELLGLSESGYELALLMALGYPAADEKVRLEKVDPDHNLAYWRTEGPVHHVPKLELDDLLI